MSESSWPFDSGSVTETTWSRMARVWGGTGVVGYAAGTSAQVYGDSSGLQVKIRAGWAQLRGHHWHSDAEVTKSIGANSSGNPRIDRIVPRLDPSANTRSPCRPSQVLPARRQQLRHSRRPTRAPTSSASPRSTSPTARARSRRATSQTSGSSSPTEAARRARFRCSREHLPRWLAHR